MSVNFFEQDRNCSTPQNQQNLSLEPDRNSSTPQIQQNHAKQNLWLEPDRNSSTPQILRHVKISRSSNKDLDDDYIPSKSYCCWVDGTGRNQIGCARIAYHICSNGFDYCKEHYPLKFPGETIKKCFSNDCAREVDTSRDELCHHCKVKSKKRKKYATPTCCLNLYKRGNEYCGKKRYRVYSIKGTSVDFCKNHYYQVARTTPKYCSFCQENVRDGFGDGYCSPCGKRNGRPRCMTCKENGDDVVVWTEKSIFCIKHDPEKICKKKTCNQVATKQFYCQFYCNDHYPEKRECKAKTEKRCKRQWHSNDQNCTLCYIHRGEPEKRGHPFKYDGRCTHVEIQENKCHRRALKDKDFCHRHIYCRQNVNKRPCMISACEDSTDNFGDEFCSKHGAENGRKRCPKCRQDNKEIVVWQKGKQYCFEHDKEVPSKFKSARCV